MGELRVQIMHVSTYHWLMILICDLCRDVYESLWSTADYLCTMLVTLRQLKAWIRGAMVMEIRCKSEQLKRAWHELKCLLAAGQRWCVFERVFLMILWVFGFSVLTCLILKFVLNVPGIRRSCAGTNMCSLKNLGSLPCTNIRRV